MKENYNIKENSTLAFLASKKLKCSRVALVFRQTIHLHNTSKEEFLNDERWLKHELAHIEQYKKLGTVKFLVLYIWYSIKYGYQNNPFEVEAREKEKEFLF